MISVAVFLIPYALFFLIFAFFAFVDLYMLIRWSTTSGIALVATLIFIVVAAGMLFETYQATTTIDWAHTIPLIPSFGAPTF